MDVMLSQEEISFREEFKKFLSRPDLSFILRIDKEDEASTPFAPSLPRRNWEHWPPLWAVQWGCKPISIEPYITMAPRNSGRNISFPR